MKTLFQSQARTEERSDKEVTLGGLGEMLMVFIGGRLIDNCSMDRSQKSFDLKNHQKSELS